MWLRYVFTTSDEWVQSTKLHLKKKKKSWHRVNELGLKEIRPFTFNEGFIAFYIGNHFLGSPWCCQAVVRHSVSRKTHFQYANVTCRNSLPFVYPALHLRIHFSGSHYWRCSAAEMQKWYKKQHLSCYDDIVVSNNKCTDHMQDPKYEPPNLCFPNLC